MLLYSYSHSQPVGPAAATVGRCYLEAVDGMATEWRVHANKGLPENVWDSKIWDCLKMQAMHAAT